MVFQQYNLFPHRTALENVMEGMVVVQKQAKEIAREKALALLEKVGLKAKADFIPLSTFWWSTATCRNCPSLSG